MSKRRLSHQQSRRIASRRSSDGEAAQQSERGTPGRVIAQFGRTTLVEDADGKQHRCHLRANLGSLVAGDGVVFEHIEDSSVVVARDQRRSVLQRPDARGQLRPIAANIDLMLVVIAPVPEPHANLIDRYLVAATHEGINVALVLNKRDRLSEMPSTAALLADYEALGYPVVSTGPDDPEATALAPLIQGKTIVLVGQSGVGKSSLLQRLLPDQSIKIGALSSAVEKGRHTTTTATLFHLPSGADLIDSPGIREFHLTHVAPDQIARGFVEFLPLLGHCQFRDCRHRGTKGCAIEAALEAGVISSARYASFLRIIDSLDP